MAASSLRIDNSTYRLLNYTININLNEIDKRKKGADFSIVFMGEMNGTLQFQKLM